MGIKFQGNWEPLIPQIEQAIQKKQSLEIALTKEEFDRLKKLNGHFFCGKGLGESDLRKDIWTRMFLIPGNSPKLFIC